MCWYAIDNIGSVDSPGLVIYRERVAANIKALTGMVDDLSKLRPHVKTNKMKEVSRMLLDAGIRKFKCATIAEAEMLAMVGAPDVLLAHQPVGPKQERLLALCDAYPATLFSCIVDNILTAEQLSALAMRGRRTLDVLIDLNVGMNRTGIQPEQAYELFKVLLSLPGIRVQGIHVYDGHIRETDLAKRREFVDAAFEKTTCLLANLEEPVKIVAGGSPSFPVHATRKGVECSPGTFIFWDWKYRHILPDEPFDYAALVITRIISVINDQLICLDLGHKAIAAENPFPRVHFLNMPEAEAISQSEEHLVVRIQNTAGHQVGDVWYGVPEHICPTVALYQQAYVVEDQQVIGKWDIVARNRSISI
ncbi:D-TA family PLP-dependent enzyme [[Flexibacter] sp. ATCC 35208]|uniref:D-TA family PLP-dependent enzyme n=1 Tax=[Flexibacter] sp. ATCC 35208 TaxID=1936242 RepID=UPI0009CA9F87|nr:D-TA family PLP-dependent enzyme [[Flexibacter] sp. ATCC 35208]OMP77903.1 threonine aldolase [[Flexibacter] sp. ATCC 35208]